MLVLRDKFLNSLSKFFWLTYLSYDVYSRAYEMVNAVNSSFASLSVPFSTFHISRFKQLSSRAIEGNEYEGVFGGLRGKEKLREGGRAKEENIVGKTPAVEDFSGLHLISPHFYPIIP